MLILWIGYYERYWKYSSIVGRLHLNRQVIVLMSGLDVPNKAFFALQDNMLQQLANMLIREDSAIDALAQVGLNHAIVDFPCHFVSVHQLSS